MPGIDPADIVTIQCEMTKLRLEPGDVVVLMCRDYLGERERVRLEKKTQKAFPGHEVVIYQGGCHIGVVSASKKGGAG